MVSKMNQPKKNHAVSAVNFDDVCIQGIFTFIQLHLPKQIRYLKIYPKKVPKNVKIDGRYDKIVNFIYLTAAALNFVLVWVSVETLFSKDKEKLFSLTKSESDIDHMIMTWTLD